MNQSQRMVDRAEFVSMIIGEGSYELWLQLMKNDKSKLDNLIQDPDSNLEDLLASNLYEMDINELNQISIDHRLDVKVYKA